MDSRKLILVSVTLVWCLGVVVQGFTYDDKEIETVESRSALFERWRSHHNLESISVEAKRKQYNNFLATLETVQASNKAKKSYKLGLNKFSGMSKEEFRSQYTGLKLPLFRQTDPEPFMYRNFTDIPPKIDWKANGALGRVRNQQGCGSCAQFAASEALDGLNFIKTKNLVEVSPKELLDCGNVGGCSGSFFTACYDYVAKNGGITTDKNYPYKPVQEPCNHQKEKDIVVEVHGYENIPAPGTEENLLKIISNQPASCGMYWNDEIASYKEGVYEGSCGPIPIHAVAVVGFDETPDGQKYWLIKNSWGPDWGDKGYMKLIRGKGGEGHCGIAHWCAYPTFDDTGGSHKEKGPMVHSSHEL
ncbi:hypothetical protein Lser_V15G01091 [Lactuca serriola]